MQARNQVKNAHIHISYRDNSVRNLVSPLSSLWKLGFRKCSYFKLFYRSVYSTQESSTSMQTIASTTMSKEKKIFHWFLKLMSVDQVVINSTNLFIYYFKHGVTAELKHNWPQLCRSKKARKIVHKALVSFVSWVFGSIVFGSWVCCVCGTVHLLIQYSLFNEMTHVVVLEKKNYRKDLRVPT